MKKWNSYFLKLDFDLTPFADEVVATAYTHGMDYYCSSSAPIVERPPMPPSPKSPKSKSPLPAASSSKIVGSRKKANTTPHSSRKVRRPPFFLLHYYSYYLKDYWAHRSFSKYASGPDILVHTYISNRVHMYYFSLCWRWILCVFFHHLLIWNM